MGLRASEASYGARRPAPAYQARWAIRIPSPRRTARAGDCSGEDALPEEARDEHGELMGALRVGIVPGPLDHRDAAESGGHLGDDPLGLSPGVGPVVSDPHALDVEKLGHAALQKTIDVSLLTYFYNMTA